MKRRELFQLGAGAVAGLAVRDNVLAQYPKVVEGTVRDRFWTFNCPPNTDFGPLKRRSLITPAEFTFLLGVPNIIMVQASTGESKYGRFEPPFEQYALALRPFKRLVWSVVGSGGFNDPKETEEVLALADKAPNFAGIMLDDFFTGKGEGKRAQFTVDELKEIRSRVGEKRPDLPFLVTVYYRQLDLGLKDYLELIDVITLWGGPSDLSNLEANLAKVEKLVPRHRKMLGCYLVDYGKAAGLPIPLMELQCETGLRWLREGRIEGMIFLGNTSGDLGFESVDWAREWIAKVGDTRLT